MPNWAKGSLKLRGKSENIASALKEMLLSDTVTLEEKYDGTQLEFNNTAPYFYINGTRRAFIDQKQIEVWLEEEFCTVELDDFEQAWSVIPEIIKKFQVSLMSMLKSLRLRWVWNLHRKLKFPKVKLSKMFVGNTMIINGKSRLAIWEDKMTEGIKLTLL